MAANMNILLEWEQGSQATMESNLQVYYSKSEWLCIQLQMIESPDIKQFFNAQKPPSKISPVRSTQPQIKKVPSTKYQLIDSPAEHYH